MLIFLKLQLIQTQSISEWRHSRTVSVHFVVIYNLSQNFSIVFPFLLIQKHFLLYEMTLNPPDIGSSNLFILIFFKYVWFNSVTQSRITRLSPQLILHQYFGNTYLRNTTYLATTSAQCGCLVEVLFTVLYWQQVGTLLTSRLKGGGRFNNRWPFHRGSSVIIFP